MVFFAYVNQHEKFNLKHLFCISKLYFSSLHFQWLKTKIKILEVQYFFFNLLNDLEVVSNFDEIDDNHHGDGVQEYAEVLVQVPCLFFRRVDCCLNKYIDMCNCILYISYISIH